MHKRSSKDINQIAANIVEEATGEEQRNNQQETATNGGKNPAAVELGRLGGLKGGKARAAKLTPEQRKDIAQIAATARWKKD